MKLWKWIIKSPLIMVGIYALICIVWSVDAYAEGDYNYKEKENLSRYRDYLDDYYYAFIIMADGVNLEEEYWNEESEYTEAVTAFHDKYKGSGTDVNYDYHDRSDYGYSFFDLDGDGQDELLRFDYTGIRDIVTIINSKPVSVAWYDNWRHTIFITDDGYLYHSYCHSGVDFDTIVEKVTGYSNNKMQTELIEENKSWGDDETITIRYTYNDGHEEKEITEEEYENNIRKERWGEKELKKYFLVDYSYEEKDGDNGINTIHGIKFENTEIDVRWGWSMFDKNADEYDHDLAVAGLVLSQVATRGKGELTDLLGKMGFENLHDYHFDQGIELSRPSTMFASRKIKINGKTKILVTVVVKGTTGLADVLTDLAALLDSFHYARDNVGSELSKYIKGLEEYYGIKVNKNNLLFYVTGHSLGGAVSGLLGDYLCTTEKKDKKNVFVYTFAAPQYATSSDTKSYNNIHNIVNNKDFIPFILGDVGGLYTKRYGHDWWYNDDLFDEGKKKVYDGFWNNKWASANPFYHHLTQTYLGMLITDVPDNVGSGAKNNYSFSSIHCPVDIKVIGKDGTVYGYTEGENVYNDAENSLVMIFVDGEEKYVVADDSVEYTIEFYGTDTGTMEYSQKLKEIVSGDVISEKTFPNVKVGKGKRFSADIDGKSEVTLHVLDDAGNITGVVDESGNETISGPQSDMEEKNTEELSSDGSKSFLDRMSTGKRTAGKKSSTVWIIIVIVASLLILAAVVVFIVVIPARKKGRTNKKS